MTSAQRKIEVLGPGCGRCQETLRLVQDVVLADRLPFEVVKSDTTERMLELGLLATPGVAIDGKVVISGRIPKREELRVLLASA